MRYLFVAHNTLSSNVPYTGVAYTNMNKNPLFTADVERDTCVVLEYKGPDVHLFKGGYRDKNRNFLMTCPSTLPHCLLSHQNIKYTSSGDKHELRLPTNDIKAELFKPMTMYNSVRQFLQLNSH